MPTLVMRVGASHPAMQRAIELLRRCLANDSLANVEGTVHFMIATDAEAIATKIARHIAFQNAMTMENAAHLRRNPGVLAKRL